MDEKRATNAEISSERNADTELNTQPPKKKGLNRSVLLIALCWLVYTCSYIGKLGYNANITQIEALYKISHAQAGMVSTFFFFAYGVGQIINGLFCKKYNLRFVVFGSLILSGLMNLLVGLINDFEIVKYLWLVNGAALSVLWTSLIRLLSETLDKKYMSTAILVMGTTVATGTFLVYGLSALFVAFGAFKSIFFVAGLLVPIIGLLWVFAYPFLTQKTMETNMEAEEKEKTIEQTSEQVKPQGMQGLWGAIILLAVFAVADNLVKDGLTTWVPTILKETYNLPDYASILLTLLLPVLAIFGTAVTVELHKKIKNFVLICALLFLVATALIGAVLGFLPTGALVITIASFALVSCLMSGVNNVLTSMAPLYWKDKINSGALAGVLNGFCYLGSTISSYGLGAVADAGGWSAVFWLLFALCAVCTAAGLIFAMVTKKCKKGETQYEDQAVDAGRNE